MADTRISGVRGRRVWDSRGRPTVEVDVTLKGGASGRAIAPAGASMGSGEAVDLRDGGKTLGGFDVSRAVNAVNGEIAAALAGKDAADQQSVDQIMRLPSWFELSNRRISSTVVLIKAGLSSSRCFWSG